MNRLATGAVPAALLLAWDIGAAVIFCDGSGM
jgi:hypothetical protein